MITTVITWILVGIFLMPSILFWIYLFLDSIVLPAWYATQETVFLWRVLWDVRRNPVDAPKLNYIPYTLFILFLGWFKKFFYGCTLESVTTINSKVTYIKRGWGYERIVPENHNTETSS